MRNTIRTTLNILAIPVRDGLFIKEVEPIGITEYGISWQDLTEGKVTLPMEGARFDIHFTGKLEGEKIKGEIKGIDYLTARADGRFQINMHAAIITNDGASIATHETGLMIPPQDENMIAQLRLSLGFITHIEKYKWINNIQCWAMGEMDWRTKVMNLQAYHI